MAAPVTTSYAAPMTTTMAAPMTSYAAIAVSLTSRSAGIEGRWVAGWGVGGKV